MDKYAEGESQQREIRFRIWDSEENKFYEPTFEAYKGNLHEIIISLSGGLSIRTMHGLYGTDDDGNLLTDRYKLMQYTGLKDKNGKDIYESDIVRFRSYAPTIVVFSERDLGFRTNRPPETGMVIMSEGYSYEVIGNIHQDSHLLEGGK